MQSTVSMMTRAILVAMALCCFVVEGMAADFQQAWRMVVGLTSGDLAQKDAALISSAGLSWPDGRQAIVTFWKAEKIYRCVDFFNADYQQTGGACHLPANE
jgi:hypothetical protein